MMILVVKLLLLVLPNLAAPGGDHNRELVPLDAPENLTLLEIKGRQVLVEWGAVEPQSVRGSFKGYLVRTWNDAGSQVYAFPPDITKANVEFFPFSKNFITVSARNEKFVGPPSHAISFDAPQIEPSPPLFLNVDPLGDDSVFLQWAKPLHSNGILLGYKVYCSEVGDSMIETKMNTVSHQIDDPDKLQAKLTGMKQGVTYKVGISVINCAGEGQKLEETITLERHISTEPSIPKFIYKINYTKTNKDETCYKLPIIPITIEEIDEVTEDYDYFDLFSNNTETDNRKNEIIKTPERDIKYCIVDCMILWIPDVDANPGNHFFLKYRQKNEEEFQTTQPEMSEDFIILSNFNACKNYEIVMVAVDGQYRTESDLVVTPTQI